MEYTKNFYEKPANSFKPQCTGKDTAQTWYRSRGADRGF